MPQSQRRSPFSRHPLSSRLTLKLQGHQPLQRTSLHRHPSQSPESKYRPHQRPSLLGGAKCLPPSKQPAKQQNPHNLLRGSLSRLLAR